MKKFLIFPVLMGILVFSGCGKADEKIIEEDKVQEEQMFDDTLEIDEEEVEKVVEEKSVENKDYKTINISKSETSYKNKNLDEYDHDNKIAKNETETEDDDEKEIIEESEEEDVSDKEKAESDAKEVEEKTKQESSSSNVNKNAGMMSGEFIESLSKCSPKKESFKHPFSGEVLNREIVGLEGDKCVYTEQMPGSMTMRCKYSKETLKNIFEYYKMTKDAESVKSKSVTDSNGNVITKIIIDGVELKLDFSMNEILLEECVF